MIGTPHPFKLDLDMAKKYIDAELLKVEIKRRRLHFNKEAEKYQALNNGYSQNCYGARDALRDLENFLDSLQQEQPKENVEKVCGTCTYWQEGTLDRGQCQAGGPYQTHSAETCERWERHEEIRIKEQPCEDLKGEIREWVNLMVGASFPEQDGDYISEEDYRSVIRQTALHFYELGKQSKEPVSEDLEEAAENYIAPIENDEGLDYINFNGRDIKDAFIAGAEWQKEQMPMPEDTVLFNKGVAEGRRLERQDMLKDAVEAKGVICKLSDRVWISPVDEEKFHQEVYDRFVIGQTVKIVIVKED